MGHERPIDFSHIRMYMCQLLRAIFIARVIYRVSRQYCRHSQIRLLNQTGPKISLGIPQQIKTD